MQKQKGPETVRLPGLLKSLVVLKTSARERTPGLEAVGLATTTAATADPAGDQTH
jgi:hypothetical protein